jgi:hypothetical protein
MTKKNVHPSLLLLFWDPGSGIGKNQDPGSGINIPDPPLCIYESGTLPLSLTRYLLLTHLHLLSIYRYPDNTVPYRRCQHRIPLINCIPVDINKLAKRFPHFFMCVFSKIILFKKVPKFGLVVELRTFTVHYRVYAVPYTWDVLISDQPIYTCTLPYLYFKIFIMTVSRAVLGL